MNLLARIFRKTNAIDLGAPAVARDPFPHYEALRRAGSVQYLAHHHAWIVLGYDDVHFALTHPSLFSNRPYAEVDAVLLAADPPAHTASRRIIARYFAPDAIEPLCAFAEEHAVSLLRPEMDVVRDYSLPLSEAVAARLLGFDDAAVEAIRAAHAATPELAPYTRALDRIAERAAMYGRLRADGLGDAEVRSLIRLLWLAATTTTERVIARCVLRLLQHEDMRRTLERDPALIPGFVEEVLRLHPPELMVPRIAAEEVPLGGRTIPAGAAVYLCVAAANRDPAKFENAPALLIDRAGPRHLTFGFGIHHCVGAALGRRELATAVRTLLTRAPRFRAVTPLADIVFWSTMTANAIERLVLDTGRS